MKERYVKRKDIKERKSRRGHRSLGEEESKEALASLEGAFGTSMVVSEDTMMEPAAGEGAGKPAGPGPDLSAGPAQSEEPETGEQAYCMKCKRKVEVKGGHMIIMKNGKGALKGICSECGGNVIRPGARAKPTEQAEPDLSEAEGSIEAVESDLSEAEKSAEAKPKGRGEEAAVGKLPEEEKPIAETKPIAGSRPPAEQAWCMKCGKRVAVKDGHTVTMKNGKGALMGTCSECGGHVIRFGAKGSAPDKE